MGHQIKFLYYDAKGRIEFCRLMMQAKGLPYEDVIISSEDWKTEKSKTPFGQLPVIEVDGVRFAQSVAIANFIAKLCGYYGKDNLEALEIDQVVCLSVDCLNKAVAAFHQTDDAKKQEILKNFAEVEAPKFFALYEGLLKKNGTGYFVGNSLTLADICIYDQMFTPSKWKTFNTDDYPLLQALRKKIENQDKIKAYLATRKVTEF